MLLGLAVPATFWWLIDPAGHPPPTFHLFSGATMLCAFFIATDPVSAATSRSGRLVYGAGIGALVFVIRSWGGYPDGVAFAVLLMNMAVPAIDQFTHPRTYGHAG
jgi:electron transport complex protein RnfD